VSAQTPYLAARRDAAGGPGRSLSARARGGGQRRGRGSEIGAKSAAGPETGSSRVVVASRKRARPEAVSVGTLPSTPVLTGLI